MKTALTILLTSLFWIIVLLLRKKEVPVPTSQPVKPEQKKEKPRWPASYTDRRFIHLCNLTRGYLFENPDRRLSSVFDLTWEYFSENPDTREFTECHYGDLIFQIFAHGTPEHHEYEVIIVMPDSPDTIRKEFEGEGAEKRAERYILDTLNLDYGDSVDFQITGLGGPEHYYDFDDFEVKDDSR